LKNGETAGAQPADSSAKGVFTMKKRWLALLLAALLCLSLLPSMAAAEGDKLFMRYTKKVSGQFVQNLDPAATFDSYTLTTGWQAIVVFYYGTEDNAVPVPFGALEPDNLIVTQRDDVGEEVIKDCVVKITAGQCGVGTVSYQGASFTVNILPEVLLYESAEADAKTLSGVQCAYGATAFSGVLKATDGWRIDGIAPDSEVPAFVTVTPVEGEAYANLSVDLTHEDFAEGSYTLALQTTGTPYGGETPETMTVEYELEIEAAYTEPALYIEPERKSEYLLGDEIPYTGENTEFYVLWEGMKFKGIDSFNGVDLCGESDADFEIYDEEGQLVGYKLMVTEPAQSYVSFELVQSGTDARWELGFSIVDNRPLFRCRALTFDGEQYHLDTSDMLSNIAFGKKGQTVGYVFYEVINGVETPLTLDDLTFPDTLQAQALNSEETWIALTFGENGGQIEYTAEDGTELTLSVVISNAESGGWGGTPVQSFEFNDVTYKIGLASGDFIYDEVPLLGLHGDRQTVTDVSQEKESLSQYVMAVVDQEGIVHSVLSANIQITGVAITQFYSLGGSCLVEQAEEDILYYDVPLKTINLTTRGACIAEVSVSYELSLPGQMVDGVADFRYRALPQAKYDLDLSEADTAEELNGLLSSPEALVAWMEVNAPEEYELYTVMESMGDEAGMSHFNLYLPAAEYEEVIVVQLEDLMVNIYGTLDAEGNYCTILPGLHLKNKTPACNLEDLHFRYDDTAQLLYDGMSCGVLACGDEDHLGDGNAIENCLIEGFACGVRNTPYGHVGVGQNNLIRDCTYGLYMDCKGKERGSIFTDVSHTIFADCSVGAYFKNLPDYMDPIEYRVYYCDFIDVETDFQVDDAGKFYFYRNYYGHYRDGVHSLEEVKVLEDIQYQKPKVVSGKETLVFTNPRRVVPCNLLNGARDERLCVDNGRETAENYIFNSETKLLVMDAQRLSQEIADSGEGISLSIVNDSEAVQAVWNIQ